MIRNLDEQDEYIKAYIALHPGSSFTQLSAQSELSISTLRYRLLTMELAGEILCKKLRNQNQYFPKTGDRFEEK